MNRRPLSPGMGRDKRKEKGGKSKQEKGKDGEGGKG